MQFYNSIWILMNFLKSVHCRYQKHSSWWWLHRERLGNKARWRAFTLLLSLYPSTTRHTFSKTIVFKHTTQPSSLIGRYAIGFHSFPSYNSLLVSEDTDGKMLSRVITKEKKGEFHLFLRGWERREYISHPPHIYVCTHKATPRRLLDNKLRTCVHSKWYWKFN